MTGKSIKPRLLVTTSRLPRFEGDPAPRFVLDLAKGLGGDFDVTILAPSTPNSVLEEDLEGVHVVRYRTVLRRFVERLADSDAMLPFLRSHPAYWIFVPLLIAGLYRATRRLLSNGDFACVHCHWLIPQGAVQALLFRRASDPPFVITCHGADVFGLNHPVVLRFKRIALKRASAVTVVSNAVKAFVVEKIAPDIDSERIRVASMGVDLERFDPGLRDDDWPERCGLTRPVILFVGRLAEKKGTTYLLRALAMEPLRSTAATLAIVGDGPLRGNLAAEAERLGIADRVRFLGALDHTRLPTVYASADIFCAPSVEVEGGDRESFGVVLCEAAASGVPAVGTRVGGIPEVVRDGETGLLVAEKDPDALSHALADLVTDEERRTDHGGNARVRVKEFSWITVSDKYADVIRHCVVKRSEQCR